MSAASSRSVAGVRRTPSGARLPRSVARIWVADMPAIVMGDLNTWEPSADGKTSKFFTAAGLKTPFGPEATFRRKVLLVPIELKLDWVWLRGLEATNCGIDRKIEISDHWPLWTNLKFR